MLKKKGLYRLARKLQTNRSIEGAMMLNILTEKDKIGPVIDVFVSEDEGLMCVETKEPSPWRLANTAWIRRSRGGAQWARQ